METKRPKRLAAREWYLRGAGEVDEHKVDGREAKFCEIFTDCGQCIYLRAV